MIVNYPKCPKCRYEFDAEDIWNTGSTEFPTENDGDETETECSDCGEHLSIRLNLEPSWVFIDEFGDEL